MDLRASMKYDIDGHAWWAPTKKLGRGWIAHKDSPSAPTPPDPYQTANAQTQSNQQTAAYNAALNRVNTYTPWGSLTYSQSPGSTQTTTAPTFDQAGYDAALAKYNATQQQSNVSGVAPSEGGGSSNIAPPNKSDFMTSGGTTAGSSPQWSANVTLSPDQQKLLDLQNQSSEQMGQIGLNQLGQVSNTLSSPVNFNGAPAQVANVKAGPLTTNVATTPLQSSAHAGNIQNQVDMSGVPKLVGGDQLYGAMQQAQDAAYKQAASRLDPQWTNSNNDLRNQLTQQGVMQNSDAWNRAMSEQSRNQTDAYQTAQNNAVQQGNAAEAQLYGQGLSSNQNAYMQALNNGQFANSAQALGFGQSYANAQLANAAAAQQFGQGMANANLGNSAQAQQFGQGVANAGLQNQARQQNISEIMQQRQEPLNELNALRTGSQVTAPNFPNIPGASANPTDIAGLISQNYANQMGGYNSQVAQNNGITNGLFSLGSAYLMGL
jgi:hypothetical protein